MVRALESTTWGISVPSSKNTTNMPMEDALHQPLSKASKMHAEQNSR